MSSTAHSASPVGHPPFGRRTRSPSRPGDGTAAISLTRHTTFAIDLHALALVGSARANPVTGSVLVFFDVTQAHREPARRRDRRCVSRLPPGDHFATATRGRAPAPGRSAARACKAPDTLARHGQRTPSRTRLEVVAERGLAGTEAARRLATYGPNSLPAPEPKSAMAILVDQVATLPVALLAGAAAVSLRQLAVSSTPS